MQGGGEGAEKRVCLSTLKDNKEERYVKRRKNQNGRGLSASVCVNQYPKKMAPQVKNIFYKISNYMTFLTVCKGNEDLV